MAYVAHATARVKARALAEAIGVTLAVLLYIWWIRPQWGGPDFLRIATEVLPRPLAYVLWCIVQQAIYQHLVYKRLRSVWGPRRRTCIASGALFGAVHWPNPVLVPATGVWGAASSAWFERRPSVWLLGLVQSVLSGALYFLVPRGWHHNFRVGPAYWEWSSLSHSATSFWASVSQP